MPSPAHAPSEDGSSVLVVDDNIDAAEALALWLRAAGYRVEVSTDAADALARAPGLAPRAIVLDIGLPEIDGYEVARRLRRDPRTAATTLIALTGYSRDEDREQAMRAGFDHHLGKPADQRLLDLLRDVPPTSRQPTERSGG